MARSTLVAVLLVAFSARADEGMWTFNEFPGKKVLEKYGFEPTPSWLEHVRLSSARLARGCSASFVSPSGLVLTNHHCASRCIEELSTKMRNYLAKGYLAKDLRSELRCPEVELNQLVEISDVTERVNAATQGLSPEKFHEAQKAVLSTIEKECASSDLVRCDVISLYRGGKYNLYKFHRYQDVRLVFAPEQAVAFFGGDPDNFNFPRYDPDFAFLRVYEDGKPAKIDHYLSWSANGAKDGELTFVSGHPGGTSRSMTVAQLEFERDVVLPGYLMYLAELRGYLTGFQAQSAENKRISAITLFSIENGYKGRKGRYEALLDKGFFAAKSADEAKLRARVEADPALKKESASAWDDTAKALERFKRFRNEYRLLEEGRAFSTDLFSLARTLVRAASELKKPNAERLREYADARLPALRQSLFSDAPIYDELEIATLTFSLTKLRELLGADHPAVKKVLGERSPEEAAADLIKRSHLKELRVRKSLFEGGLRAINESRDPMILLAILIDDDARALRKRYETEVDGPLKRAAEQIARARFKLLGTSTYPDATFTLRLSYGQVKGYSEGDKQIAPFTTLEGAFDRHTGREPFALPHSWLSAKPRLELSTPLNFVTTNDIIGGNSGSPVINREAELVGLIFDGNIHSLGGDYGFEPEKNRAVAVHSSAILEALEKVYGASRIVTELRQSLTASDAR